MIEEIPTQEISKVKLTSLKMLFLFTAKGDDLRKLSTTRQQIQINVPKEVGGIFKKVVCGLITHHLFCIKNSYGIID